jgi:hypothetical protein
MTLPDVAWQLRFRNAHRQIATSASQRTRTFATLDTRPLAAV